MKENIVLTNYKGLSQEELENLPIDELARIAHEALQNWNKLNQVLNQDSTNSNRAHSTDSPEAKAKRKAEEKAEHQKQSTRKRNNGVYDGAGIANEADSRSYIGIA